LGAELLKVSAEAPEVAALRYACDFIQRGLVVGIPTDTFYGLAADPFNLSAVEQIYQIKLNADEQAMLRKSADAVKELVDVIKSKMTSA